MRILLATVVALATAGPGATAWAAAALPPDQAEFCRIIDAAAAAYATGLERWRAEKDDVAKDRIAHELDEARTARDKAVYAIAAAHRMGVANWRIKITRLSTYERAEDNTTAIWIALQADAHCKAPVTLAADFRETPALEAVLANLEIGDDLLVTAYFTLHDAATNPIWRAMNWDGVEQSAMEQPSYRLEEVVLRARP